MNEWDIERAAREERQGVAGKAASYLLAYMHVVNRNSDGWLYWTAGSRAAKRLCEFVDSRSQDEAMFKMALRPIKSICTRRNLPLPTIERL